LKSEKYNLSAAEASAIKSKDAQTMNDVYVRECERRYMPVRDYQGMQVCRQELNQDSSAITIAWHRFRKKAHSRSSNWIATAIFSMRTPSS